MSISSFVNNLALQKQVYTIVDAGNTVNLTVNAVAQVTDLVVIKLAGAGAEITLSLPAGLYALGFQATVALPAAGAGGAGLQNVQVYISDSGNQTLVSQIFNLISAGATLGVNQSLYSGLVVDVPVPTVVKLRCNYINVVAGFTPSFVAGNQRIIAQPIVLY
jgi:hypothetical protein